MLRPFNSSTGPANASHVAGSMVAPDRLADAATVEFQDPSPRSSFHWRDAPHQHMCLPLAGRSSFTTREGETSVVRPATSWLRPTIREQSQTAADRR